MIRVCISGAASRVAGELIRILVNHPDVELAAAYAPGHTGERVTSIHHGLIGETDLQLRDTPPLPSAVDALVICEPSEYAADIALNLAKYPDLRVIDISGCYGRDARSEMALGISEINRKTLVRGATRAYVPGAAVVEALIALYPFAASLLLGDDIAVSLSGRYDGNPEADGCQAAAVLATVQNSFDSKVVFAPSADCAAAGRGLRLGITFPTTLLPQDIRSLYDGIYDDHHFTFLSPHRLEMREVEGTHKCLIYIDKPDAATVRLDVIADAVVRGGAGDAVHVLNLLFGLHERTGLALKASEF